MDNDIAPLNAPGEQLLDELAFDASTQRISPLPGDAHVKTHHANEVPGTLEKTENPVAPPVKIESAVKTPTGTARRDSHAVPELTSRSSRISVTSNTGATGITVQTTHQACQPPAHMKTHHTNEVLEMLEKTGKAENPVISPEMLKTIAELPKDARRMIASNQNAPQHVLGMLAEDSDKWVRWEIASNRNTPPHAFEKLSGDSDRCVRLNVARNPNTSPHVLEKLSGDSNEFVRWGAAENPRVSMGIYEKLRCDPSDMVKYAALGNPC